jgi:hypothetical protein
MEAARDCSSIEDLQNKLNSIKIDNNSLIFGFTIPVSDPADDPFDQYINWNLFQ